MKNLFLKIVFFMTLHLVTVSSCQRRCLPSSELGDPTYYKNLHPSEFPPLQFTTQAADSKLIENEIKMAQDLNSKLKLISLIFGNLIKLDKTKITAPIWQILSSQFLTFKSLTDLQHQKLEYKIRNDVTEGHIHLLLGELNALKVSTERMLDPNHNNETKLREIVPARFVCSKIVALFSNKNFVFWKENLYTTRHLLKFALIQGTLSKLSKELDPSHVDHYQQENEVLINLMEEYKQDVMRKRCQAVSDQNSTIQDSSSGHWLSPPFSKNLVQASVCDHLYYTKCLDYEARVTTHEFVTPNFERRVLQEDNHVTSCTSAVLNEEVGAYYKEVLSWSYPAPMHGAGNPPPIHPILNREGAPAVNENFIYDSITQNYFCGPSQKCLEDYQNVLRSQVHNLFEEHFKVLRGSI